jgi:hypothetical protein
MPHGRCDPVAPFDLEGAEPAVPEPVAVLMMAAIFLPQQRQRLGAARYGYAPTPAANRGALYPAGANSLRADAASPSRTFRVDNLSIGAPFARIAKGGRPARIVDNAPRLTFNRVATFVRWPLCLGFRTLYVGHHET